MWWLWKCRLITTLTSRYDHSNHHPLKALWDDNNDKNKSSHTLSAVPCNAQFSPLSQSSARDLHPPFFLHLFLHTNYCSSFIAIFCLFKNWPLFCNWSHCGFRTWYIDFRIPIHHYSLLTIVVAGEIQNLSFTLKQPSCRVHFHINTHFFFSIEWDQREKVPLIKHPAFVYRT
jgi:hypothetical protein